MQMYSSYDHKREESVSSITCSNLIFLLNNSNKAIFINKYREACLTFQVLMNEGIFNKKSGKLLLANANISYIRLNLGALPHSKYA